MQTRVKLLLLGLFSAVVGFVLLRGCDKKIDTHVSSTVLAPGVIEKIMFNPNTHKLDIFTPGHEQELFLPDRPSSIEISNKGTVNVTSRQYGTELKPFMGLGYSDKVRIYTGLDLLYYKRWDTGFFTSGGIHAPFRLGFDASYTVYSNTRLALGVDNNKDVNLFVSVRF